MIYTRFGSVVKVTGGDIEAGEVDVIREDIPGIKKTYINELKADGGFNEICEAIDAANAKRRQG